MKLSILFKEFQWKDWENLKQMKHFFLNAFCVPNSLALAITFLAMAKPEDHWSSIAHLNTENMLKSAVTEEMNFKNIESE